MQEVKPGPTIVIALGGNALLPAGERGTIEQHVAHTRANPAPIVVLERDVGWAIGPAEGGWRRLVPSPRPLRIVERAQIQQLVRDGTIVIAAGGGGIPVYRDPVLLLEGVDAVIDKDRAAQVLARDIE